MTKKDLYEKYLCNLSVKEQMEFYERPFDLAEYIERQSKERFPGEKINSFEVAAQILDYMRE